MSKFLIIRGEDLVLLGLSLTGFKLVTGGTTPTVEAAMNKARFVVTFPPQHIGEEATSPGAYPSSSVVLPSTGQAVPVWANRLADASRIAFEVAMGTRMTLSVDGVLTAMAKASSAPVVFPAGPQDTMLEIPWGLLLAPVSGAAGGPVKCGLSTTPVASLAGVVGLWRARVLSTGAALGLKTVGVRTDVATDPVPQKMPLAPADRSSIANAARTSPAGAHRLELTALGGSLSARGVWDGLSWRHEASLGRDMAVQVVRNGILYPFGQPAVFVSITERLMEEGSAKPVAALRKQNYLLVTEQVRTTDASRLRAFPFHQTEITAHRFDNIDTPVWKYYAGAQGDIPTLKREVDLARANVQRLGPPLEQRMRAAGWRPDPYQGNIFETDWYDYSHLNPQYNNYKRAHEKLQDAIGALAAAEWWAAQAPVPVCFKPTRNGQPVMFPVRLANAATGAHVATPLVFVADVKLPPPPSTAFFDSLQHPAVAKIAADLLGGGLDIKLPALRLDMIGSATRAPADLHEVHGLLVSTIGVSQPRLASFRAALPALRTLLGEPGLAPVKLAFSSEYLQSGEAADVVFRMADATERIPVDFTKRADRAGGLVSPQLSADAISRKYGPVQAAGLVASAGNLDPAKLFGAGATILGFKITDLIGQVKAPPTIMTQPGADGTPEVTMRWPPESLKLKSYPPFATGLNSTLDLVVHNSSSGVVSTCTITDFALELPPKAVGDKRLLRLAVQSLTFAQKNGREPQVKIEGLKADFLGPMKLLKDLQEKVDLGGGAPKVEVGPKGITAGYALPIPAVSTGAFVLRNIVFRGSVEIPFDGRQVAVGIGFASRQNPFSLTVMAFGGGGYIDLLIDASGLRRLEATLEFGAAVAVDFVVARGEVHALGGIRYVQSAGGIELTGFIRVGGSLSVLGLVSVAIELVVGLTYQSAPRNRMVGRATLVVEIDLFLYSDRVEIDSGEWVLAGDAASGDVELGSGERVLVGDPASGHQVPVPAAQDAYWEAFADHE